MLLKKKIISDHYINHPCFGGSVLRLSYEGPAMYGDDPGPLCELLSGPACVSFGSALVHLGGSACVVIDCLYSAVFKWRP